MSSIFYSKSGRCLHSVARGLATTTKVSVPIEANSIETKPFSHIPGPKPLPLIGNLWRYMPIIGKSAIDDFCLFLRIFTFSGSYDLNKIDQNGVYNLKRYGTLVLEKISANHRVLYLFDPSDIESMFKQEGPYPYRRSHRALIKYRSERPDQYRSGGIFPENGHEWARLRNQFKKYFLLAPNINSYCEELSNVSDDLITYIRFNRDGRTLEVADLQDDLYKWALESVCLIMLDSRIGCLDIHSKDSIDAQKIIDGAHATIDAVMRTEMYPGWEKPGKETKDYRMLVQAQDAMAQVVGKHLNKQIGHFNKTGTTGLCPVGHGTSQSLLTQFLSNKQVDRKDLFGLILDFVLAGIDTTSISVAFTLYYLALNPSIQEQLRQEICDAVGEGPMKGNIE